MINLFISNLYIFIYIIVFENINLNLLYNKNIKILYK